MLRYWYIWLCCERTFNITLLNETVRVRQRVIRSTVIVLMIVIVMLLLLLLLLMMIIIIILIIIILQIYPRTKLRGVLDSGT